jgi:hypothetical protein
LNRSAINQKANRTLKRIYADREITRCEVRIAKECTAWLALSWHHRHKRRWYGRDRVALLSDFNQTILVCLECHKLLEKNPQLSKDYFLKLRGEE